MYVQEFCARKSLQLYFSLSITTDRIFLASGYMNYDICRSDQILSWYNYYVHQNIYTSHINTSSSQKHIIMSKGMKSWLKHNVHSSVQKRSNMCLSYILCTRVQTHIYRQLHIFLVHAAQIWKLPDAQVRNENKYGYTVCNFCDCLPVHLFTPCI